MCSLQQYCQPILFIQSQTITSVLEMRRQEEQQTFHFVLTLLSIKMKVKFPCRMVVEQAALPLTKEVPPSEDGRFLFNQEIRLKEVSEKLFTELNISLITEKGARYTSGLIKLFHNELIRSEGDRLVVTLSKCLDSEALCELKVEKVVREGGQRKRTLTTIHQRNNKGNPARLNQQSNPPTADLKSPRKLEQPMLNIQTKSQTHFPVTSNLRFRKEEDDYRSKQHHFAGAQQATNKRFGNISPKGRGRATINSKSKYQLMQLNNDIDRDKLIEAEVYRDNYHKLKQKYLRETENSKNQLNKRIMLEQNENHFKLEIVRMKMRNQELEKTLAERNQRMKDMASTLSILQGRESQINIMREDLSNKANSLHIMEETIITLSKENDQLRSANKDIAFRLEEKIISLENEIEILNSQSSSKQQDLERELKMMGETLQFKENQLFRKGELLEREKRNVYELERSLQAKMFEYDSLLQSEKGNCRAKMDQFKSKLEQAHQAISKMNNEKADLSSEMDKLKGILLKNEYQFKLYQQQIANLRNELQELKPIRDKHNDIFKQLRLVAQQKMFLQKNHEKMLSSKEVAFEEMASQFKKECEYIKRNAKDLDERNRTLSSKLIESEGQLDLTRGSLQKLKKNHENLSKEYSEVKEKEKTLKKSLKVKQQQVEDARKQILRLKQKHQTALQSMKVQLSRMREEVGRTKIQLQSQIVKNQQLVETNTELNMELARLKMTHQFSEEKYEKLATSSQQKYSQFQRIIQEHEGVIQLLQEKIRSQKENQKDHYGKLQRSDYEISLVVEKNDKIAKQMRTFEEKSKQLQFSLRNKQVELAEALKKVSQLEAKTNQLLEKAGQSRETLQLTKNELQKSKKIIEILQRDYDKTKADLLSYSIKLTDKQREYQEKSQQLRKQKQATSNLQSKNSAIKKQYQRFKQSVNQAINSSFTQILNNFSFEKQENSKISTLASIEYPNVLNSKRGIADLSGDLVNAISQAGRQSKAQVSKLSERAKQLQRDLELMKNENDRLHELSKRQLNQKAHYIEQIQEELRNTKNDKGESQVHYQMHVSQLQEHLRQYQGECQSLLTLKGQLEFSISSFKLDLQRLSEQYQKKVHQLKKQRQDYEQKIQYQYHNTQIVEKKAHELQVELLNVNSLLILEKESCYKKELKVAEIQEEKQRWVREAEGMKKLLKMSEEKYSELEIQFITVTEMKEKYESMLNEEENKLKDVRVFNNCILKEKEEIIKKELQKNLQIANLQNAITELQHSVHQQQASKQKIRTDYQQSRQHLKRISLQFKDAQAALNHEKNRYNEIRDKLREKQSQLSELKEEHASQKKRYEEQLLKSKHLVEELKEENEAQAKQLEIITNQANESERSLQRQVSKLGQQLQAKREELGQLQEAIFVERENNQSMQESISRLKMEVQDQKKKIQDQEQTYDQLMEQNKEKDESMFEMGGKIYELQSRMREMQEQKLREIEQLNNSLNIKYDEDYQQIYQKIEFIQKEKEYFKEKYQEKEEEVSKKNEQLKIKQIQQIQIKRGYEEKIKKLQQEKLVIFTDKNKEVSKVLEENKSQFEAIRFKEAETRKVAHQLQISRATIQKLQAKIKQMQSDKSGQVKAYQGQIEQLRKKELLFKSFKDEIRSNQWNCEREVRKHIQNFIKKILEVGEKEVRNESVIGLIKGLEEGILAVLSTLSKE